jgi:hypothetical protein
MHAKIAPARPVVEDGGEDAAVSSADLLGGGCMGWVRRRMQAAADWQRVVGSAHLETPDWFTFDVPNESSLSRVHALRRLRAAVDLGDVVEGRSLGIGAYSRTRVARRTTDGAHVAVKTLEKSELVRLGQVARAAREIALLQRVTHPFVVRLHAHAQNQRRLFLVYELCHGGGLAPIVHRRQRLADGEARFYAAELLLALAHLHAQRIAHRSLRPEKLLLDHAGHVRLVDFALAKVALRPLTRSLARSLAT